MRTAKLTDDFGVELLDLSTPLSTEDRAEVKRLFETEHLLLVRKQNLEPEQFVEFVGCCGRLRRANPDGTRHMYISNTRSDGLTGEGRLRYHSDAMFFDSPVWGLALHAEEISAGAPPTHFVNTAAAYQRLPDQLKRRIDDLHAVHLQDLTRDDGDHRWREQDVAPQDLAHFARSVHPLVLRDKHHLPPLLFVGELHTSHIEELGQAESDGLLEELFTYVYDEDGMYVHHWDVGDIVVWNNVALQHGRPPAAEPGAPRTLRRAILVAP